MEQEKVNNRAASSFNRRYFFKLGSNVTTIIAGIVTSAIVPRALGVAAYGNFSFATSVLTQALNSLDLRASTCLYVKLAQRPSDSGLITFYGIFILCVFAVLSLVTALLLLPDTAILFEGIGAAIVWLSLILVYVKWAVETLLRISDAYGATSKVEGIKIIVFIAATVTLVVIFLADILSITTFFLQQIALFSTLFFLIGIYLRKNHYPLPIRLTMKSDVMRKYRTEFIVYSSPLALYMMSTLVSEVFDRYTLQHFGGSFQQGLYGFSYALASVIFLFVTAMVPLLTREFSVAFSNNDILAASRLYRKYVPMMYIVSSYFCCFLLINADFVIEIFAGQQFMESLVPMRIMMLYPLASTYSNLNGSVVFAKEGNVLFRNIAFVIHPLGMVLTFVLVSTEFGDLGAVGLALKVLSMEFVSVCVVMLYVARHLEIKLGKYFLHMFLAPAALISVAYGVRLVLSSAPLGEASIIGFIASGIVYTVLVALMIYVFPRFVGLSRPEFSKIRREIASRFSKAIEKK